MSEKNTDQEKGIYNLIDFLKLLGETINKMIRPDDDFGGSLEDVLLNASAKPDQNGIVADGKLTLRDVAELLQASKGADEFAMRIQKAQQSGEIQDETKFKGGTQSPERGKSAEKTVEEKTVEERVLGDD